ncbi:peptidoglycan DD-metalloendopeptidase family protein [Arcticibacter sp. MXS-1]|uniref:peptidoglycan DD-metalloendopeptidase family protein n=1 Tax=Arcticibacter sp. MXS-1 TaxID=3341726 RepID=UPI0035A8D28C
MKLNRRLLHKKVLFTTLFSLLIAGSAAGQSGAPLTRSYPTGDFIPPLDIRPSLSGSFGEIRAGHFHSGLDYRTNQREGYPVYAVADGFVSRLRVQIGGFGNALYIGHPNGYTTVYAHLQRFSPRIERIIKDYQYRKRSFDVDFPLMPIEIPVKKGEIVAWSGNTGGSGGPHLHFEIRDSKTEETVNPQLFGIDIPDNIKPAITALYMYRTNGLPFSENTPRQYFDLSGSNGKYYLTKSPVINIGSEVGFGIITYDPQPAGNQNGVYSIELKLDTTTIYLSMLERFAFANSRAVNSHIDYPYLRLYGRTIQKSFVEPGNPLKIYKTAINRGLISLKDQEVHTLTYRVSDVKGNTSTLSFKIRYNPASVIEGKPEPGVKKFVYNQPNEYTTTDMKVNMPRGVLYSDIDFRYEREAKRKGAFSATHKLHTPLIPLHSNYDLWIKADSSLPPHLYSKALIVDSRGVSQGGTYDKGFIKGSPRVFGEFYVKLDTIPPTIRPLNIADGKQMAGISKVSFKISDNLSGIRSFEGTIDGQWVLMEYDPKTATLWHIFDSSLAPGKHHLQLLVTDMMMNSRTFNATFYK